MVWFTTTTTHPLTRTTPSSRRLLTIVLLLRSGLPSRKLLPLRLLLFLLLQLAFPAYCSRALCSQLTSKNKLLSAVETSLLPVRLSLPLPLRWSLITITAKILVAKCGICLPKDMPNCLMQLIKFHVSSLPGSIVIIYLQSC